MLKKISLSVLLSCPAFLFAQNNVGIGTNTPTDRLQVVGSVRADTIKINAIRLAMLSPSAGKVLTSDAAGFGSWQTPAGGSGGTLTDAYNFGGAGAGRIINAATATLRVDGGYGLQVFGVLGTEFVENPGAGSRMFFNPGKVAFRAGFVNATNPNLWNEDSVGVGSVALGSTATAKADHSVAIGIGNRATGNASFAIGSFNKSVGPNSIAIGSDNTTSGSTSIALGKNSVSSGSPSYAIGTNVNSSGTNSFAMGEGVRSPGINSLSFGRGSQTNARLSIAIGEELIANSYSGLVVGRFNDSIFAVQSAFNAANPVFLVGNGTANNNRNNAFVVLGNGSVGVGLNNPVSAFDIDGTIGMKVRTSSSNLQVTLDNTASVWYLTGTATVQLPLAATFPNRQYTIVNATGFVKNLTTGTPNYFNFSGTAVSTIPANTSITVASDGGNWLRIH